MARAAFAIANGLGAVPLRSKLAEIAGRAGVHLEPSAHPSGSAAGASGEPARRRRNGTRRSLTARELEVLELLVAGNTDGEIAATLFISRKTVSVHVANIKSKLGAESRVEIVTSAIRRGIVETRTDD